ncbi:MAG: FAD-dependent oxidoreductase, partial [Chitinophagaceae bacterium]
MQRRSAIVIGAGIAGLATARSLAKRGYQVTVFERNQKAVGASIRNFGMIWPIGQPTGRLYEIALRSKSIWKQVCTDAGLWFEEKGSLHLAYNDLEWQVINDFAAANNTIRPVAVLNAAQSGAVNPENLKGALFSSDEMIVEARDVIEKLPAYLHTRYGIQFYFSKAITAIDHRYVLSGNERYEADKIFVCSG